MNSQDNPLQKLSDHLFRENSGKMVAVLSKVLGLQHLDLISDVIQDSFEAALKHWRYNGVPENPSAWLMQVAKNNAINAIKKFNVNQKYVHSTMLQNNYIVYENQIDDLITKGEQQDSLLRLLFICCDPKLSEKNQLIITLNLLCGFGISEVANALWMEEFAVRKALARSKERLRKMNNILESGFLPINETRLKTVLKILYLMFNEGYKTTRNESALNHELCYESLRLTKMLYCEKKKNNEEVAALLALMFFNIARFPARLDENQIWISLRNQNRNLWNKAFIEEGLFYLNKATQHNNLTCLHLEAMIASVHCSAVAFEDTDWNKIIYLYSLLEKMDPSPLVKFNLAIAESHLSPEKSLTTIHQLEKEASIKNEYIIKMALADIYSRTNCQEKAIELYTQALKYTNSETDRKFIKQLLESNK